MVAAVTAGIGWAGCTSDRQLSPRSAPPAQRTGLPFSVAVAVAAPARIGADAGARGVAAVSRASWWHGAAAAVHAAVHGC